MSPTTAAVATLAVPCRNADRHLEPLLESLLAQTRQDFDLLLVDDASTDGSADLARRIAGDRIEVHRNPEPLGIAGNWNRCAQLCRTPFFCLAHMDDIYEPPYLERMVSELERRPDAGMAHCKASAIDDHGRPVDSPAERYKEKFWARLGTSEPADVFRMLYRGNFIACPSVLYRTAAWREVGPFPDSYRFALDWWLHFRMLLGGYRIVGVPQVLIRYRRHAASASVAELRSLERYREERRVLCEARDEGQRAGLLPSGVQDSPALRNNLLFDAWRDLQNDDWDAARAKLRFARAELPAVVADPVVRLFAGLVAAGRPGRALLGLGLRAALLRSRP